MSGGESTKLQYRNGQEVNNGQSRNPPPAFLPTRIAVERVVGKRREAGPRNYRWAAPQLPSRQRRSPANRPATQRRREERRGKWWGVSSFLAGSTLWGQKPAWKAAASSCEAGHTQAKNSRRRLLYNLSISKVMEVARRATRAYLHRCT